MSSRLIVNSIRHTGASSDGIVLDSGGTATYAATSGTSNFTISDGNLVIGTAGHGIDFSVTSGAGTSELLDDYEEGSWTPQIRRYENGSFGTAATMTDNGTVQRSTYAKIGNVVTIKFYGFQQSNANYAALGGLPYNATSSGGGGIVGYTDAFTNNQGQKWVLTVILCIFTLMAQRGTHGLPLVIELYIYKLLSYYLIDHSLCL